jgi:nucleotide-binding universal stress UspA family protein
VKIERILTATDFSEAGHRAVATAVQYARRAHAALRIVHVLPPKRWLTSGWRMPSPDMNGIQQHAEAALQRLASGIDHGGELEISTAVLSGSAASTLVNAAAKYQANLLVIGARGEGQRVSGEPGLGGTSSKLVTATKTPLLLVRCSPSTKPPTVIAAVELSAGAEAVLDWAKFFARGEKVHVFHAYEAPFTARLESYGFVKGAIDIYSQEAHARCVRALDDLVGITDAARVVERGDAVQLLNRYIDTVDANLLVLGKHVPRARRASSSVGSVCRHMAAFARTDVLVVPFAR